MPASSTKPAPENNRRKGNFNGVPHPCRVLGDSVGKLTPGPPGRRPGLKSSHVETGSIPANLNIRQQLHNIHTLLYVQWCTLKRSCRNTFHIVHCVPAATFPPSGTKIGVVLGSKPPGPDTLGRRTAACGCPHIRLWSPHEPRHLGDIWLRVARL